MFDLFLNVSEIIFIKVMSFERNDASEFRIIVNVVVRSASLEFIAVSLKD